VFWIGYSFVRVTLRRPVSGSRGGLTITACDRRSLQQPIQAWPPRGAAPGAKSICRGAVLTAVGSTISAPVDRNAQAREYVLLALRCDRLAAGLVDAFTGAPALRRQVANEPRPTVEGLAGHAGRLRAEVASSSPASARAHFLNRQLVALECMFAADGR